MTKITACLISYPNPDNHTDPDEQEIYLNAREGLLRVLSLITDDVTDEHLMMSSADHGSERDRLMWEGGSGSLSSHQALTMEGHGGSMAYRRIGVCAPQARRVHGAQAFAVFRRQAPGVHRAQAPACAET